MLIGRPDRSEESFMLCCNTCGRGLMIVAALKTISLVIWRTLFRDCGFGPIEGGIIRAFSDEQELVLLCRL